MLEAEDFEDIESFFGIKTPLASRSPKILVTLPYRPGSIKACGQGESYFPKEAIPWVRVARQGVYDTYTGYSISQERVIAKIPLYKLFGSYISK